MQDSSFKHMAIRKTCWNEERPMTTGSQYCAQGLGDGLSEGSKRPHSHQNQRTTVIPTSSLDFEKLQTHGVSPVVQKLLEIDMPLDCQAKDLRIGGKEGQEEQGLLVPGERSNSSGSSRDSKSHSGSLGLQTHVLRGLKCQISDRKAKTDSQEKTQIQSSKHLGCLSKRYGKAIEWNPQATGAVCPDTGKPWDYRTGTYNVEEMERVMDIMKNEETEAKLNNMHMKNLERLSKSTDDNFLRPSHKQGKAQDLGGMGSPRGHVNPQTSQVMKLESSLAQSTKMRGMIQDAWNFCNHLQHSERALKQH
jgi:hypothetical protein